MNQFHNLNSVKRLGLKLDRPIGTLYSVCKTTHITERLNKLQPLSFKKKVQSQSN